MCIGFAGQILNLLVDCEAALQNIQRACVFAHVAVGAADLLQRRGLVAQAAERFCQPQCMLAPFQRLPIAALALVNAGGRFAAVAVVPVQLRFATAPMPEFWNELLNQTYAGRPVKRPTPPRTWFLASPVTS